jgi:GNAT superfamily N-acetyltransferase
MTGKISWFAMIIESEGNMNELEIRKISSHKDLKKFVGFPFQLYKGNAFWVPPIKSDEINTLRKDKNPVFEYCEAECWIAYRDNKPVGRIAGIINHHEIEHWNSRRARFGWIDFIDDQEVSRILIETVINWSKAKGMNTLRGPMGFTNMDSEGMLIEGFEEISSLSAIYNFPYYPDHIQKLGFRKDTDLVQYEIRIPSEIPEKVERLTGIIFKKYGLHLLKPRTSKELQPYIEKMFLLYNMAFNDLYGFTALTGRQIQYYSKKYLRIIRPDFVSLVIDERDDVVGFGIAMPSLDKALQKARGSLLPFGFIHLRRALRKNDITHLFLVGVRPDYQGKGLLALVYQELHVTFIKAGMKLARTHPQLEDNLRAVSIWKNYDSRVYIRRRCWIREV